MKHLALLSITFILASGTSSWAQTVDAFGKPMSPPQIDKRKKEGLAELMKEKEKAEKACKTTFSYSLDWNEFDSTTWDQRKFNPYHLARDCGLPFGVVRGVCEKGPEARTNVQKYFKKVVCKLHPQYHPIMKWMKDNDVQTNVRAILEKQDKTKYDTFFKSNCRTGDRISPSKHILCKLADGVFTVEYSMWSVNNDSEIQSFLRKYFSE